MGPQKGASESRRGSSLVEVLAAVVLLTIIAGGMIPIFKTTALWLGDAHRLIQAASCAYSTLEYVRFNPALLEDGASLTLPAQTLDDLLPGINGYARQGYEVRIESRLYLDMPDLYLIKVVVTWAAADEEKRMEITSIVSQRQI